MSDSQHKARVYKEDLPEPGKPIRRTIDYQIFTAIDPFTGHLRRIGVLTEQTVEILPHEVEVVEPEPSVPHSHHFLLGPPC